MQPQQTSSQDSADRVRKRVCTACDRCRLKKSKCDGSSPCARCRTDNVICIFGKRKKSRDEVYPKGYVKLLEHQQSQLVEGLREMYRQLHAANAWSGPALAQTGGHPLTHDILSALHLLETKGDGSGEVEVFEEDCNTLQKTLSLESALTKKCWPSKYAMQNPSSGSVEMMSGTMDNMFDANQFRESMAFDDFNSNAMSMMTTNSMRFVDIDGGDIGLDPNLLELDRNMTVKSWIERTMMA